jgi:hypothetical protein
MRTQAKLAAIIGLSALGSGCIGDDYRRADGLTDGAGNAMAANTVMQMVDPWQDGVQDTRLLVPAVRGSPAASAATDAAEAKQTQTTDSGN